VTAVAVQAEHSTWDNVDRAVTLSFRPLGLSRGAIARLYELARGGGTPLSYRIADDILRRPGSRVGLVSGAVVPGFLPRGENDGPLGAMVLAHVLGGLGYDVALLAESELRDMFEALFGLYDERFTLIELDKDDPELHARTAPDLDALVSIEKLGSNRRGVMHGATGTSRNGMRARVDGLVDRMNADGRLTIGIGDGGNEIGFGRLFAETREIVDHGAKCLCPCGDGIVTITPTTHLFPVGVSNWGAYAVAAALCGLTGHLDLLHTAARERELLSLATEVDCRDGYSGTARNWLDGVPAETSASIVQILVTLAETNNRVVDRPF
jgi:D-glutamate cyclase